MAGGRSLLVSGVAVCALAACFEINPLFGVERDDVSETGSAEVSTGGSDSTDGTDGSGSGCGSATDDQTCDGIDDDCDGIADDDYVSNDGCGVGHCQSSNTPSACVRGVETPCVPGEPIAEIPGDGIDQGCNGGDGPEAPPAGSFFDDFEDGDIDPRWSNPSCGADCSIDETGGAMRFGMSGAQSCTCVLRTNDLYSIVGQGVLLDVPAITSFHAPLRFFMVVTNVVGDRIEYGFRGDDVFYAEIVEGDSTIFLDTSIYVPRPRYWQIREQGGMIYFESSMDAVAWDIEMQTESPFYLGGVRLGFGTRVESSMPSGITISSPNFNIVP
ncbi:hypothetical protein [Enhygromyxa salina]|nr:hypothetical protein [Enhygromyxa salina]